MHWCLHMIMEFFHFIIHILHVFFSFFNSFLGRFYFLKVFFRMFLLFNNHIWRLSTNQLPKNIWTMSAACAAILNRRNMFHINMLILGCVFFKWQYLVQLFRILDRLELFLIRLNLLFQIFNSLSNGFSNC